MFALAEVELINAATDSARGAKNFFFMNRLSLCEVETGLVSGELSARLVIKM